VPVLQAEGLGGLRDLRQVFPPHDDVDILGEAPRKGVDEK
jgi:hypothetical protein